MLKSINSMNSFGQKHWAFYATFISIAWSLGRLTSQDMTSSCRRPFPPLTLAGATDGTADKKTRKEEICSMTQQILHFISEEAAKLKSMSLKSKRLSQHFLFTWTWLLLDWLIMRSEIHRTHAEKWLKWHNTDSHACEMFLVTVSRWTPRAERNLQTFRDAGQKAITSGDQEEWSSALPRSVLQIWIGVTKALLNVICFLFLNPERMSWSVCNIHTEVKQELIACYYDAWTPDLFNFMSVAHSAITNRYRMINCWET